MAAVEGVDVVSISAGARRCAGALSDSVLLYPGDELQKSTRTRHANFVPRRLCSWAIDVVPRLTRQQAGQLETGEREVRVIVYNGTDHYNAAVLEKL